ncbi:hypothetical protein PLICRDRAFT_42425 [Plicaturopsis crispa FD-325 SS-3]|nr:hypothetical protein PLICRDRAFT_42425 [Plicaturopsis crispa FD-325 SS-3]
MSNATVLPSVQDWNLLSTPPAVAATAGCLLVVVAFYASSLFSARSKTSIPELGGISILTAWPFFNKRFDFMKKGFAKTKESMFQFKVLQHRVVALSGEEGRKAFLSDKSLNFNEGYKILMGGAPRLEDIDVHSAVDDDATQLNLFKKRLHELLHKDRLNDVLPTLFDDMNERMQEWGHDGKSGRINPFKDVYDLVFQMTVRMATCRELSSSRSEVERLSKLYWELEKSATPVKLLLPWFPSKAKKDGENATMGLYMMLNDYVELRRNAKVPSSDAIDVLIQDGTDNPTIIGFILGVVFAGVINTGINSCWVLIFLAAHPEWKARATAEVNALVSTHTNTTGSDPLHKRLAAIPMSAWEEEMPVIELIIRETLRLIINGTLLRRNVAQPLEIDGKIIDKAAFLAYNTSDVHLNSDIYSDPLTFDPSRFNPGREEDKKGTFTYLAWGAGRHPCAGMKVAKLEMKMILALFLAGYEYDLVDESGKFPKTLPQPNRNDLQQARPLGDPCYLQFKRVVE